jgi:hypothetical protein
MLVFILFDNRMQSKEQFAETKFEAVSFANVIQKL